MLSSTRILTFLLSSLLVAAQDDRCPRPEAIAPCQCRTRGPTIQGENPSLNNQSCNRRPLCCMYLYTQILESAHDRPTTFFSVLAQTAQNQESNTPKNPLMQDWVFRLRAQLNLVNFERPT